MQVGTTLSSMRTGLRNQITTAAFAALFEYMDLRLRLDPGYRRFAHAPRANGHEEAAGWWRRAVRRASGRRNGQGRSLDASADHVRPDDSWRSRLLIATRDDTLSYHVEIASGRLRHGAGPIDRPDATLLFADADCARAMLTESPSKVLEMLLEGTLVSRGNLSDVARLSFMLNGLALRTRSPFRRPREPLPERRHVTLPPPKRALPMKRCDRARHLTDPALSDYTIDDFPRLERFRQDYFALTPTICTERARLYTEGVRRVGFERDRAGRPVNPVYRQAEAFHHVMSHRRPIVRDGDLLAGTTTSHPIGVLVYPECGGVPIWPELETVSWRRLNPYRIAPDDVRVLAEDVLPFWMDRNVREVARAREGDPLWLQLDERFALYFQWKTQAVSHTIPDFPAVLGRGLADIAREAQRRGDDSADASSRTLYRAMARSLDGVMAYARALSAEATRLAAEERDPHRRAELEEMARISAKVPAGPADSLHEALQSVWTVWIACHMESTNAGLSIGRIDQWLQPYFEADMARLETDDERRRYTERAVELTGCFLLRCTDHLPQVADLGNKLFGGSASGQVITLGGVTAEGENGVADMTFICLKVTEMLGLKDPNINARFHEGKNSPAYLARLCEVNYLTGATPSIHNDAAVIDVLVDQGFSLPHARDYSATGCVEPTSCGRHYGHTNCMMFNLVAPLEMALRDGYHPLLGERLGPRTGDPRTFERFEDMLDAYREQLRWLIEIACTANNRLGEAHRLVRPTPLLSSIFDGPMESGRDLIDGGARYNTSGTGNVGLVDVVDSLVAIKKLVYDEKRVTMASLLEALDADFVGHEELWTRIHHRVPRFGTGNADALGMARDLVAFIHDAFRAQPHYRGGHYNSGFWSMSNHVAFGILTGALPSGRRRGKAFTPGLTPAPDRGGTLLSQIQDVASLDHHRMPNNVAFNVKVVPAPGDSQESSVRTMSAYAQTYVQQGGMQLQFNVVSSATLRDAREHPDRYPDLLVRISGYNAYFNDLNDEMKVELIERTEHHMGA